MWWNDINEIKQAIIQIDDKINSLTESVEFLMMRTDVNDKKYSEEDKKDFFNFLREILQGHHDELIKSYQKSLTEREDEKPKRKYTRRKKTNPPDQS